MMYAVKDFGKINTDTVVFTDCCVWNGFNAIKPVLEDTVTHLVVSDPWDHEVVPLL
jgi:hypothetical protein